MAPVIAAGLRGPSQLRNPVKHRSCNPKAGTFSAARRRAAGIRERAAMMRTSCLDIITMLHTLHLQRSPTI